MSPQSVIRDFGLTPASGSLRWLIVADAIEELGRGDIAAAIRAELKDKIIFFGSNIGSGNSTGTNRGYESGLKPMGNGRGYGPGTGFGGGGMTDTDARGGDECSSYGSADGGGINQV